MYDNALNREKLISISAAIRTNRQKSYWGGYRQALRDVLELLED